MITLGQTHAVLVELHGRAKEAAKVTGVHAPNFGEYAKRLYRDNVCTSDDEVHTDGAFIVHIASEEARTFRDAVASAAAAQRRYCRWDPRHAKKLARAVMALLWIDRELTKEDVIGKLSGNSRVPAAQWSTR